MFSVLSSFTTEPKTEPENETEPETEPKTEPETETEPKTEPKTEPETELSSKQKMLLLILNLIADDSSITTSELAEKCGKSRTTIQSYIRLLKSDKRIVREGANKGGHWLILWVNFSSNDW